MQPENQDPSCMEETHHRGFVIRIKQKQILEKKYKESLNMFVKQNAEPGR